DPLYVGPAVDHPSPGSLIPRDSALFIPDTGTMVVGVKRADDLDGVVVKLVDVTGASRSVGVWPAAYAFTAARTVNLVEMNGTRSPPGEIIACPWTSNRGEWRPHGSLHRARRPVNVGHDHQTRHFG